ncbi:MAG: twin transmembrane helix small protein [Sneathiella sp.]|nr:twin transmembrane helix small protein [Sneathiella sp.]
MLNYLIIAAIAATALVLLIGIIAMSKGGEFNRKHSNKLMRLRIAMQAIAVLLIMASFWIGSSGD